MAMILTNLTEEEVSPVEAANWSLNNGHRVKGNGTSWEYFDDISEEYGVDCLQQTVSTDNIVNNLQEGKKIIMSMKPGHFTQNGHFIVLTGMTEDGKITVADPSSESRSQQTWDIDVFLREGKQQWSFS